MIGWSQENWCYVQFFKKPFLVEPSQIWGDIFLGEFCPKSILVKPTWRHLEDRDMNLLSFFRRAKKISARFQAFHGIMDPITVWEGTANPPNYSKLYPSPTSFQKVRLDP